MSVYEIYAKMEFYNFILSRKINLSLIAEICRFSSRRGVRRNFT